MKALLTLVLASRCLWGIELHVSVKGSDNNSGSVSQPLLTISAAASRAHAGDTITVHEGTYRERITPPRGAESESKRIVYQASPGEKVFIKGSEIIKDWKPFLPGVWKATIPNKLFGKYNPYKDVILGDWFTDKGRPHHTGEVYLNGKSLWETNLLEQVIHPEPTKDIRERDNSLWAWFAEVDAKNTYIYANFHDKDPNKELVEINVRDSVFYPDQTGRNYITVRGFQLSHAATQWAAPTAEQIALIGTNWSKGWIIEDNIISDSKCACVSLGKDRKTGHNVWINDPRKDGATHYNEVIVRALEAGWTKENIGSHIVRNNTISHCEQAGIVGSLGAVFSQITGNHIHDVWAKRQFTGAEMAGIKLHGAIDVLIKGNRIHYAGRGLWMDWMAQGTRISANLLYDNVTDDLFVEVDHGPFVVDNNLFLSNLSLNDMSEGGAYAHNFFAGRINSRPEPRRSTPYHKAHSTALGGLDSIAGGDDRFYNNIFAGEGGLWVYNHREYPLYAAGNVYLQGARPYFKEEALKLPPKESSFKLIDTGEKVTLQLNIDAEARKSATKLVTTELLGKTKVAGLAYENPDGSPLTIDHDFFGKQRNAARPGVGPFEDTTSWGQTQTVTPTASPR